MAEPQSTSKQGRKQPHRSQNSLDTQKTASPSTNLGQLLKTPTQYLSPDDVLMLQRTIGNQATRKVLAGEEKTDTPQSTISPILQRSPPSAKASGMDKKAKTPSSGELAWEIFSPIALDGIRSLAPGALKGTDIGNHYKEVIDVVDKLEDSTKKIKDYHKKIADLKKESAAERKFALKSMGKVNAHFKSIPDALPLDGDALIDEAASVVNQDMFSDMVSAVEKLETFAVVTKATKKLHDSYGHMITRLSSAESQVNASHKALGILEDALMDMAKYAVLPAYQAWAFGTSQKVAEYRGDVGTVLSTIRSKRKGYENTLKASSDMEGYMNGTTGRKSAETNYRDPKNSDVCDKLKVALPAIKADKEEVYDKVLAHADFEEVMDALDFLPIMDSDGFFAVTEGLRDAYPDRESAINQKEARYVEGISLAVELDDIRPMLETMESTLNPLVMRFVWQEYYNLLRDNSKPLLSNYRFTYKHSIKQMREHVKILPAAIVIFSYFESM